MIFNKLFRNCAKDAEPSLLAYEKIVAQARRPEFYLNGGVKDSVDGRFDMIILHAILLICRLNGEETEEAKAFSQDVFDELFRDMDQSLREMGVGDLSVGKKIKKMAQVFYGRAKAYDDGIKSYEEDPEKLVAAVQRNLYSEQGEDPRAHTFANYIMSNMSKLRGSDFADLCTGSLEFSEPEGFDA